MPHNIALRAPRVDLLWDDLVGRSPGGTVMHSRRFLGYHGDRFQDESLCIWSDPGVRLKAVMPLARSPGATDVVISHPGSTFGGLIEEGIDPAGRAVLLSAIARHLLERGYRRMIYKPAPAIFGAQFDESDLRLLTRVGSVLRADLWNFIRLDHDHIPSPKRRASIKAAERKGILVRAAQGDDDWRAFHAMLTANLASRHDAAPVHGIEDMFSVRDRISGENSLWLAVGPGDTILAGTWCLAYNRHTLHTQYIASSAQGRQLGAVDRLLSALVEEASARGHRVLSFGVNTLPDGFRINRTLLKQKLRFGSGVAVHWHFDIDLQRLADADAEAGFA